MKTAKQISVITLSILNEGQTGMVEICKSCRTLDECQSSNIADCERRDAERKNLWLSQPESEGWWIRRYIHKGKVEYDVHAIPDNIISDAKLGKIKLIDGLWQKIQGPTEEKP